MAIKIAVLVSGRGSNLEAILESIEKNELAAQVVAVLSNNPDSYALKIARKHNLPVVAVDHRGISRKEHEKLVLQALKPFAPEYLVLAGYMRILSGEFLSHYKDSNGYFKVINIHPSLLPAFPGKSAYEDAFSYGVKISGITIHLVDEQVDHGPILAQAIFERQPGDTLETFQARGLAVEHKLFPQVLSKIAAGGLASLIDETKTESSTNKNSAKEDSAKEDSENPADADDTDLVEESLCVAVVPKNLAARNNGTPVEMPLYWLNTKGATAAAEDEKLLAALKEVLADSLLENVLCVSAQDRQQWVTQWQDLGFKWFAERQYLPGVTDNLARTVEEALHLSGLATKVKVASGSAYLFNDEMNIKEVDSFCRYRHYHPVTDKFRIHDLKMPFPPKLLEFPAVHLPSTPEPELIALDLPDSELENLSRKRTLALNLVEMQTIRKHFEQKDVIALRAEENLSQWPTDVELEVIAQTWSEHCKHKIFNAVIHDKMAHVKESTMTMSMAGTISGKPVQSNERTITSLYKSYVQAATKQLAAKRSDLLSVFVDNAGVIKWNDDWGICFKVETHNSPSALEPYGGALTGILGVNRDILGTGLGAKPICNTDVFCFAYPASDLPNRPTMLPATSIIQGVRKGVQDGGNKSGIPTVNGAVYFNNGYRAKPLVFCGTGGILPLSVAGQCGYEKHTTDGDSIVMVGGRVGKDGIHGATFSSEALNIDSPMSAVQIGDPFTQKRVTDFILEARDAGLISGITDNGAGGLSSSVGEMAQITGGATLEVNSIPLKYPGLADYEIVISESQERMTLSSTKIDQLKELAAKHSVVLTVIGTFNKSGFFRITREGKTVGLLDLKFLHDGAPRLELEAHWQPPVTIDKIEQPPKDLGEALLRLLNHPNICSREPVIRQYDHEVQGGSVVKPLMGREQTAPCDAAVIQPILGDASGLVVSNGLCPQLSDFDAHLMAICAVDEAVRNAVCVGADPSSLALLDNFCWPDPVASPSNTDGKRKLGQLVQACEGLYEAVLAYNAPLISGKDSMKNDFDDGAIRISIPPTLLISAIGKVPDIEQVVTMEFKATGDHIFLVSAGALGLAATTYAQSMKWTSSILPELNLEAAAAAYQIIYAAMQKNLVQSCHDLSEGGLAVAVSECIIGSGFGADLNAEAIVRAAESGARYHDLLRERLDFALFGEGPARMLISVSPKNLSAWQALWQDSEISVIEIGKVTGFGVFKLQSEKQNELINLGVINLKQAWQAKLPFDEDFHE